MSMHFVSISTQVRPLRPRLGGFSCVWIAFGQWTRATLRRTQTRRSGTHRIAIGARAAMGRPSPISRLKSRVLQPQRSAEALRWTYVQRTQFVHRCAHEASVVSRCSLRAGCSCRVRASDEGAQVEGSEVIYFLACRRHRVCEIEYLCRARCATAASSASCRRPARAYGGGLPPTDVAIHPGTGEILTY